ncbi:MAG TPA: radical SAM protein, partial [Stellaceae bacterium]|nr:radical SAM protein [Stellaceae bacterium]
ELKVLFKEWLEAHVPGKASHVLSLVAQSHGGKLYDSAWSKRMVGYGPYADLLSMRFDRACRRLGLNRRHSEPLDTTLFRPPARKGDQLALF